MVKLSFCGKCGTELTEGCRFCSNCGFNVTAKPKDIPHKKILIGVGVFLIVAILFFAISKGSFNPNKSPVGYVPGVPAQTEKQECPFECCISNEYVVKDCEWGYECKTTKCVAIDTDGDGLTDVEEKGYGTNIRLADSDNDGLSDYQEIATYKTNPLNSNTDNDRYIDGNDPNPLIVNSAKIKITTIKNEGYWNEELKKDITPLIGCLAIYAAESSFGEVTGIIANLCSTVMAGTSITSLTSKDISRRDIEIETNNVGNDYTSYVTFKLDVYTKYGDKPRELFDTRTISIDKLNDGESHVTKSQYTFKLEDYTIGLLKNILDGKTGDKEYIFEFSNVDYERYS